jgi:hypothetical protein
LETGPQVEENLTEALREHFGIPLVEAAGDVRSLSRVSVDHLKNKINDIFILNSLLELFSWVAFASSVLLKAGQIEQR